MASSLELSMAKDFLRREPRDMIDVIPYDEQLTILEKILATLDEQDLKSIGYSVEFVEERYRKTKKDQGLYMHTFSAGLGRFQGQLCEIEYSTSATYPDRIEIFYGGKPIGGRDPDNHTHGHVVSNDGVNIHYWRLPKSEGGKIIINSEWGSEKLRKHLWWYFTKRASRCGAFCSIIDRYGVFE